ncbi:hypothetical protein [Candidatus Erwinia haradaeae]|nr:hypothetical protein [Candidatus Erwinia haradaeae]
MVDSNKLLSMFFSICSIKKDRAIGVLLYGYVLIEVLLTLH